MKTHAQHMYFSVTIINPKKTKQDINFHLWSAPNFVMLELFFFFILLHRMDFAHCWGPCNAKSFTSSSCGHWWIVVSIFWQCYHILVLSYIYNYNITKIYFSGIYIYIYRYLDKDGRLFTLNALMKYCITYIYIYRVQCTRVSPNYIKTV